MSLIVFVILTVSLSCKGENDYKNITHVVGSLLCPYTNFCYLNASSELENTLEYEPCCSSCSCDDSCYESMTCCPDKESVATRCKWTVLIKMCCMRKPTIWVTDQVWQKLHYENMPMQYTEIFKVVKNENFQ